LGRTRRWYRKDNPRNRDQKPIDSILAERGAKHVNVDLLRYFSEPDRLDDKAKDFLQRGMALAIRSKLNLPLAGFSGFGSLGMFLLGFAGNV
jgi:hypothetical protein